MSKTAKATIIGSIVLSGLTIWGVHFLQQWERDKMYQGVIRDDERRKDKRRQRQAEYEASLQSRELFEQTQRVGGSGSNALPGGTSSQTSGETT